MIRPISFIDTFALAATLFKMKDVFDSDAAKDGDGNSRILVMNNDMLKDTAWKAIKAVTAKALNELSKINNGKRPELASIAIEKLMPQGMIPWGVETDVSTLTFHIAVVTNPNCFNYCGTSQHQIPAGGMAQIPTTIINSAVNLGETPRYHVVLEIKNPQDTVTVN